MTSNVDTGVLAPAEGTTAILQVRGMTCGACERHVRDALLQVEGVTAAVVSRQSGTAEARLSAALDENRLIDAVSQAGYDAAITQAAPRMSVAAAAVPGGCCCRGA